MAPGTKQDGDADAPTSASATASASQGPGVEALKQWVGTQAHLPQIPDEALALFHHSCYDDLERSKECVEAYFTLRSSTPEFFAQRDVSKPDLAKALSALNFATLPVVDPVGCRIVYHGLRDPEPSKYMFVEGIKLLLMTLDACLENHAGAPDGIVILFNMQGARLTHLTRISISPIRKFFQYIQDANPVRLKAIHVINVVPFMDKILTIIKPFVKKELMSLLHFHSSDMEEFHKTIPKTCLPCDFGGDLPPVEQLCDKHNAVLKEMADFFARQSLLSVDETKRAKTSNARKNKKQELPEMSFDKLEID